MRFSAIAWRGLTARPLRSLLTASGVALGVAVVMATLIANQASAESIDRAARSSFGAADLRVRAFESDGLSNASLDTIRRIPGVERTGVVTERRLLMTTLPGEGEQVFNLLVVAVDPEDEDALREHALARGEFLSTEFAGELVLSAEWASENGVAVGDSLLLTGAAPGTPALEVVGLLEDRMVVASSDAAAAFVSRTTLEVAFDTPAPATYVDLDVAPGATDSVQAALDRALAEPFRVETVASTRETLARVQQAFVGLTFVFGALALFVGAFLVYNTLAMTLVERTREIGLLRAAGTTTGQVVGLFFRQALVLGFLGSAAGVIVGIGLSAVIIGLVSSSRSLVIEGMPLSASSAVFALAVGVAVTLLAAVVPAVQASRVTPLEALRPSRQPARRLWQRLRWLLAVEAVTSVAGLLLYPIDRGGAPLGGVLLVIAALFGGTLIAAFLLQPIGRLVARPFEWIFGAEARLGRASLARDRARSGLTVGALMVGLATIVTLGSVADSARSTGRRWVDSILPGGHAIRSSVPLDLELYRPTLEGTPGTRYASPVLSVSTTAMRDGRRIGVELAGIDPDVFAESGSLIFTDGDREGAFQALRDGGGVLVPEPVARRDALQRGDLMQLDTPGGVGAYEVAGVIAYSLPGRYGEAALLISLADARDVFGATAASLWAMVPEAEGAGNYTAAVQRTAASLAGEAITAPQLATELSRSLDQLIGLFDVLALIAVLVATLGIVNTLTVGVYERVREIGILRAHGMTVGQVRSMIVVEAAIMGAVGGVLAGFAGLAMAWMVVGTGSGGDYGGGMAIPVPLLLGVILLGTLAAAIGGIYPARLASRIPIVRAVQYE